MAGINKISLNKLVKEYIENGDIETAKNYIRTWGLQIRDYNIQKELNKVDEIVDKKSKSNKRRNK